MTFDELIPWFPVLVIASHLPFLIRMDLKSRSVEYSAWIGMLPMIPVTGYLYAVGYYPIECMWLSFVFVGIYFAAMKLHVFEGADFVLLAFITLFFVVNPISGHYLTPIHVLIFLFVAVFIANIVMYMFNRHVHEPPMIPVIAAAFALAVMLG